MEKLFLRQQVKEKDQEIESLRKEVARLKDTNEYLAKSYDNYRYRAIAWSLLYTRVCDSADRQITVNKALMDYLFGGNV